MEENLDEIGQRLISEMESWHGTRPWASQAAYRGAGRRTLFLRYLGPRAWVAGFAVSASLVAGGVAATAAFSPAGLTIPLTEIHVTVPPLGGADEPVPGSERSAEGAAHRNPGNGVSTPGDSRGDAASSQAHDAHSAGHSAHPSPSPRRHGPSDHSQAGDHPSPSVIPGEGDH